MKLRLMHLNLPTLSVPLLLATTTITFADVCPEPGEKLSMTQYTKETQCSAVSITVEGALNPPEYQSCLGDVPSASESVSFRGRDGVKKKLPTVAMMLSKPLSRSPNVSPSKQQLAEFKNFQDRTWVVGNVKCFGHNGVSISYWGGGNCVGCERFAEYQFSKRGELKSAYLRPIRESDRQR